MILIYNLGSTTSQEDYMEPSTPSSRCQHALLARSPVGHVSVCPDCEVVQLCLDCLSVRLERAAFLALAEMLSEAQQRLHGTQQHSSQHPAGQAHPLH